MGAVQANTCHAASDMLALGCNARGQLIGSGKRLQQAGEGAYTTTYAYDDEGRLLPQ